MSRSILLLWQDSSRCWVKDRGLCMRRFKVPLNGTSPYLSWNSVGMPELSDGLSMVLQAFHAREWHVFSYQPACTGSMRPGVLPLVFPSRVWSVLREAKMRFLASCGRVPSRPFPCHETMVKAGYARLDARMFNALRTFSSPCTVLGSPCLRTRSRVSGDT